MKSSFARDPNREFRFPILHRLIYRMRGLLRGLRVTKLATRFVGPQHKAAEDLIEIDLTYLCNLTCNNCNRSSAQAPEALHLSLSRLESFVQESISQGRQWKRIRLLGGEPTLHPEFHQAICILESLRDRLPELIVEVVTNGYGRRVQSALAKLPLHIAVENSYKQDKVQPYFGPFNMAPQDTWWHRFVDYSNGCSIAESCGMGLTPTGYYPCAIAGGIDRVTGRGQGRLSLPHPEDEMRDLMERACRLCGRFRDGHFIPRRLRAPLLEQKTSKSWVRIYEDWSHRQRDRQVEK